MRFSENLVHLRKKLGKKQEEVAIELGHNSRSRIANYESGNSKPGFDDLLELAKYYKVKIDDLIYKDLSQGPDSSSDDQASLLYYEKRIKSYENVIKNLELLNELYSTNIKELKTENEELLSNLKSEGETLKSKTESREKKKQ